MPILEKFPKQPMDRQDYDVGYGEWFDEFGDADFGVSHTTEVEAGITLVASYLIQSGRTVKVWVAGGVSGASYKVTVTLTTSAGRVKQAEIVIKVKED